MNGVGSSGLYVNVSADCCFGDSKVSFPSPERVFARPPLDRKYLVYWVLAIGHSFSSAHVLDPITKIRTGASLPTPFSVPLSQWSNQFNQRASMSILAVAPKSTSPIFETELIA